MQHKTEQIANTDFGQENLIFVGGSPRSGTTLVQRILGAHPDIYGGPEFDLVPSIVNLYEEHINRINSGRIDKIISAEDARAAFQQLIVNLLQRKAKESNTRYFSEKTPSNSLVFEQLNELLPNSRKILILRDPKAILRSMLVVAQRYKDDGEKLPDIIKTPVNCVKTIAQHQQRALQAIDKGQDIFVIHYEELTGNPESIAKELCRFLSIEYCKDMIALSEKKMDTATQDSERWYTKQALQQGITRKTDSTQHVQNVIYDYHDFLIDKYIPITHPLLSRYKTKTNSSKLKACFFTLQEYATNGKKHRKWMRKN